MYTPANQRPLLTYNDSASWTVHVVEVLLQSGPFTQTFVYEIRGNVTGFSALENAAQNLLEDWFEKAQRQNALPEGIRGVNYEGDVADRWAVVELVDSDGNTLEVELWEERDLEQMITSVRTIEVRPYEED